MSSISASDSDGLVAGTQPFLQRVWERYNASAISIRNISLVYVWILLFIVFSLWVPDTFLTVDTWKSLAAEQAVTTILALAVVVTLASGVFDLSVAAMLGVAGIWVAHLMVSNSWAPVPATAVTLVAAALVGAFSATAMVVFRINSFIATLGVSSILAALVPAISNNQQIIGLPESFVEWSTFQILGIQGAFWIALVMSAIVWFALEHRPVGRHMFATGGNIEAARLAGVRTNRIIYGTVIAAAVISAIAGIVVTSRLGTGSPTIGPPYLLPSFAAAFLSSTQVRPGRFNVLGTLIAVYALATSVKGLQLAGAPFWLPELFNGAALLIAVGISVRRRRVILSVRQDVPTSAAARAPITLRQAARDRVAALRDRTGETVSLIGLSDDGSGRVIEVAESHAALRVGAHLGETIGAAELGDLRRGFEDHHGPIAVSERDELFEARAPVRDQGGLAAALSVRAPLGRVTDELRREIEEGARETAEQITERICGGSSQEEGVLEADPTIRL